MDTTLDTTQKIIKPIPSTKNVFKALMRADLRVQWRNRRALIMTLIMPVVFVISWKSLIPVMGAYSVLATCIAVGLPATGLMAYSQTIARDRERGVFQRLRAAPISTSAIMLSRIAVQLCVIMLMTLVTYIVADKADGIVISAAAIPLMLVISAIGGAAYLAIGQFLVASIKSSDSVNAAARLVYFPLAIVGAIGETGLFGPTVQNIVTWSPFGTTKTLILWSIAPGTFDTQILWALLLTLAYIAFFATLGIKRFKWSVQ